MSLQPLDLAPDERGHAQFNGLPMSAAEYFGLPDDGFRYELVHGVLVMSPRPMPWHQDIALEIVTQLRWFLATRPIGKALMEVDVHLGRDPAGEDLVYSPDVIFVRGDRIADMDKPITTPPDLAVEVISRGSRRMDTITKRADYERAGVGEYWIIDPPRKQMTFLRLHNDKFVEVPPAGDSFASEAVPEFVLNLRPVRAAF